MRFWPFSRRRRAPDVAQLGFDLEVPPKSAAELLVRLRARGLTGIDECRLTRNRSVLVSFRGGVLRVHEGYLTAPESVWRAIVDFVRARTKGARREAGNRLAEYPLPRSTKPHPREETHADDTRLVERLRERRASYNSRHFGDALRPIPIRISRRMKSRLGHYAVATDGGEAEIVISRRHLRRHGWDEAFHTLLHEMVHQWQDESGLPIDHGRTFRRKCKEVGIAAQATRDVIPHARFEPLVRQG